MIEFSQSNSKNIGRAEVLRLVIIEDGCISDDVGRSGHNPYFLVRITFDSSSEYCVDTIPTGILKNPTIMSPDEIIATDGGEIWYGCRHLTDTHLELEGIDEDRALYILESVDLPERLTVLTSADKEHILKKIKAFCMELEGNQA